MLFKRGLARELVPRKELASATKTTTLILLFTMS